MKYGTKKFDSPELFLFLWTKNIRNMFRKEMKAAVGIFLFLPIAFVSTSCTDKGLNDGGVPVPPDEPDTPSSAYYVCAVSYPDGYNWINDEEKGTVEAKLILYEEETPILEIPVGDKDEVSSDADTHRMIGGHLYTNYMADNHTTVKRDGELLFAYSVPERIVGLIVEGNDVYTLGQSPTGKGFSCRMNGEILLAKDEGFLYQHFSIHEGKCQFAYYENYILNGEKHIKTHKVVGDEDMVLIEDDIKVYDVIFKNDDCFYAAQDPKDKRKTMLYKNGLYLESLSYSNGGFPYNTVYMILHYGKKKLYCENKLTCTIIPGNHYDSTVIWLGTTIFNQIPLKTGLVSSFYIDGNDSPHYIINSTSASLFCSDGETFEFPENFMNMGSNVIIKKNNEDILVGLSSSKGGRPIIWRKNRINILEINGYISFLKEDIRQK